MIRQRLAEIEDSRSDSVASGRRAALWRAQSQASRLDRTIEDLRNYCLDSLSPRRFIYESDSEYLRGYRGVLRFRGRKVSGRLGGRRVGARLVLGASVSRAATAARRP